MKHVDVRGTLIGNTVQVIANEGLDKTTTKAVVRETGINEAYIYRHFKDKEDLLINVFAELDEELFNVTMKHVPVMYMSDMPFETRCRLYFTAVWRFLLGNREKCLAYIRYYYSPYFSKYSLEEHRERFDPLTVRFKDAFRIEANVWMLLNHMLNVLLDFSVKIYNGEAEDNDDTAEHVFRLLYTSITPYSKKREEKKE